MVRCAAKGGRRILGFPDLASMIVRTREFPQTIRPRKPPPAQGPGTRCAPRSLRSFQCLFRETVASLRSALHPLSFALTPCGRSCSPSSWDRRASGPFQSHPARLPSRHRAGQKGAKLCSERRLRCLSNLSVVRAMVVDLGVRGGIPRDDHPALRTPGPRKPAHSKIEVGPVKWPGAVPPP